MISNNVITSNIIPKNIGFKLIIKNLSNSRLSYEYIKNIPPNLSIYVEPNIVEPTKMQIYNFDATTMFDLIADLILLDDHNNKILFSIRNPLQRNFSNLYDNPVVLHNNIYDLKIISKKRYQPTSDLFFYAEIMIEIKNKKIDNNSFSNIV